MDNKAICFAIRYPQGKKAKAEWNKRFSLNAYLGRKSHYERVKDVRHIHTLVMFALKEYRVPQKMFDCPVEITFYWDDRLDIDNHAALGKMIVDCLKKYLIFDDNPKWFKRVTHAFWDGGQIGVEVKPWA